MTKPFFVEAAENDKSLNKMEKDYNHDRMPFLGQSNMSINAEAIQDQLDNALKAYSEENRLLCPIIYLTIEGKSFCDWQVGERIMIQEKPFLLIAEPVCMKEVVKRKGWRDKIVNPMKYKLLLIEDKRWGYVNET